MSKDASPEGFIKVAVDNARPHKRSEPEPAEAPAAGRFNRKLPYDTSFPDGCPVEPLGISGDDVYFLDQKRQLRVLKAEKLNLGTIRSLFGDAGDLKFSYWPRWSKPDEDGNVKVVGWRPEQAADALYNEACRRGIIDVFDRVRGPGCWQDMDGKLIMHCGDIVYCGDAALTPSRIDRYIYPSAAARPHPRMDEVDKGIQAAGDILALLRTWVWRRPELDPELLLGWIVAGMLGGALKWRPLIWITGDKATGKSTLHEVVGNIMGPGGILSSADASAASLWQTVGHASLPIMLDELEADVDNRKSKSIIGLARLAASGASLMRGGSDHKSASFTVRSCFMFSSILIPPMLGQDVSRMAVLQLEKLSGAVPPVIEPRALEHMGRILRARIIRHWHRFPALLHRWKCQLVAAGHGGRSADQFGTLMACYDLVTGDHDMDSDTMEAFTALLRRDTLAECEDDVSDTDRCLSYLLTSAVDLYRSGERRTVGSWVQQAAGLRKNHDSAGDVDEANRVLGNIGLKVMMKKGSPGAPRPLAFLHIANDHQGLANIFRDSHWQSQPGTTGVWVQAVRRVDGSAASEQRFNGLKKRCTAIPLEKILEADGDD